MQPASEPHFGGWPTRFVLWVRSKGAPFEETVILPALIVVVAGVLVDRGKIAPWVAIVAFLVPISISALWMGVALGPEGLIRILLRSVLIGVMEGVVFVTLAPAPLDKQQVMQTTLSCVYINIFLCWFCAVIGNVIGAFAITSEANREVGGRRQTFLVKVAAVVLAKPPDQSWPVTLAARFLQGIVPIGMSIALLTGLFGISFLEAVRKVLPH